MSSAAVIFRDVNDVIDSIDQFLHGKTIEQIPQIAHELSLENELNIGLDAIVDGLREAAGYLKSNRGTFVEIDVIGACLGIIADSLVDLGNGDAFRELTKLFNAGTEPFQPVLTVISNSGIYVNASLGLLDNVPDPEQLDTFIKRLDKLQESVNALKVKPKPPLSEQQKLSNSQSGDKPS
jgi:hypothetical protein